MREFCVYFTDNSGDKAGSPGYYRGCCVNLGDGYHSTFTMYQEPFIFR
ncbi:hypothetical protein HNQ92_003770 [Rhabdobacter roseus]|uniref:Uncharacterized protein n=1 Tax=Rhabdobacter roseus TaxID=1655419 RepID=A0A840U0E3_9BACT|nr:hypothetical protein [Rhabdobacter roseus]